MCSLMMLSWEPPNLHGIYLSWEMSWKQHTTTWENCRSPGLRRHYRSNMDVISNEYSEVESSLSFIDKVSLKLSLIELLVKCLKIFGSRQCFCGVGSLFISLIRKFHTWHENFMIHLHRNMTFHKWGMLCISFFKKRWAGLRHLPVIWNIFPTLL